MAVEVDGPTEAARLDGFEGAEVAVDEAVEVGLVADDLLEFALRRDEPLFAHTGELFGAGLGLVDMLSNEALETVGDGKDADRAVAGVLDEADGDGGDVAVDAVELPEGEGDAPGELAFEAAFGLEALKDALQVSLLVARLLDAGDDGTDRGDAVGDGPRVFPGPAPLGDCLPWCLAAVLHGLPPSVSAASRYVSSVFLCLAVCKLMMAELRSAWQSLRRLHDGSELEAGRSGSS